MRYRYRTRRRGFWRRRWYRRNYRRRPRTRVYRRRRRVRKRRRRLVPYRRKVKTTFYNPATVVKCTITGWTIGLISAPQQMEQRTWNTVLFGDKRGELRLVGGGVAVRVFSLRMLWWEHQLFRNWWSKSNDGFDLARYFGTKFYLLPHRDNDYIFWWDTDYNQIKRSDYWRAHPSALLGYKNKVIVRSQMYGNNHRVKRVFIKPPATTDNEWRFQNQWMEMGLVVFGITPIDWNVAFARQKSSQTALDVLTFKTNDGSKGQSVEIEVNDPSIPTATYAFYADFPQGNKVLMCNTVQNTKYPAQVNQSGYNWQYLADADDLPYWMTFYGQNANMYMDENIREGLTVWFKIYYPLYKPSEKALTNGLYGPKDSRSWLIISSQTAKQIAQMGPFINTSNVSTIEIPLLYRSYWQWGGATYGPQFVTDPLHFAPKQVAVRNPSTIQHSIITPWDTDKDGILTETALKRFLKPAEEPESRRPQPGTSDGWPAWTHDTTYKSSSEETEETPESDDEGPTAVEKGIENLRRRLRKERNERQRLRKFFKSLIYKEKDLGGGAKAPPPQAGPPPPYTPYCV
uniref:Capsid protein n=1 Tax=Paguma larvata torque teno virus TaxID=2219036 RepID=A0A348BSP2_9VIRU|nr:hypothetical protein [Paguma larvata torque teno virus]